MKQLSRYHPCLLMFLSFTLCFVHCSKSDKAVAVDPPVLNAVNPANGIIGDVVILSGKNLENGDKVSFNGISSLFNSNTSTSITTVVPPNAGTGVNKISIHNSRGTSNELSFEVFATPSHPDPLPPTLSKTVPASGYTENPILIFGDNLSDVLKITFNDKVAVIYTNNKKVITTTIPKDLPAGTATIKVKTAKGETTTSFQVLGPPPGGAAAVNFSIVSVPPANYVPSISNQWSCYLLSTFYNNSSHTNTFVGLGTDNNGDENYNITGMYEYNLELAANYNRNNYVEIIDHAAGDTLAGQFSSQFANPCILKMVLISSKTGLVTTCIFDRRDNDSSLQCEE